MNKTVMVLLAIPLCGYVGAPVFGQAAPADAALEALFRQAEFWQSNQRPDLAREALERYVISQPQNPEVLFRLALQARDEGRTEDAARWGARLAEVAPGDTRLQELQSVQTSQSVNPLALENVRALAQSGQTAEALAGYRALFSGNIPPRELAHEYYQTLAGTDAGWAEARQALQALHDERPGDTRLALTLAEVLTYNESTRRDGIDRLAALSESSVDVHRPWGQALQWLSAAPADRPRYDTYIATYPDDTTMMNEVYTQRVVENTRVAGYAALEKGQIDAAEAAFRQVLQLAPQDPEAVAGLGFVSMRREKFDEASDWLQQAMDLALEQRSQWLDTFRSANFYAGLAEARSFADAGNLQQGLAKVRTLTPEGGEAGRAAQLLEADILRRQGQYDAAERGYRRLIAQSANDVNAQLGLIEVLRSQERWEEATSIAERLPASERAQLENLKSSQALTLREQAREEQPFSSELSLRTALDLAPDDPWIRLDLARLLAEQQRTIEAETLMAPLEQEGANPQKRYVAAMFAASQARWQKVEQMLDAIPPGDLTGPMQSLLAQARQEQRLAQALTYLETGRNAEATRILDILYIDATLSPAMAGNVALALSSAGQDSQALRWVRRDLSDDISASPGDFINHALVLARAGLLEESNSLVARLGAAPALGAEDRQRLNAIGQGMAVINADYLREQGQLASAYDELALRLSENPDSEELLLAMGRLYTEGGMHEQSSQIYDYVLLRHPTSRSALEGAIQSALQSGDSARADQLLVDYAVESSRDPAMLMLAARVASARGNDDKALALLDQARSLVPGNQVVTLQTGGSSNPFRNSSAAGDSNSARPAWLPGSALANSEAAAAEEAAPVVSLNRDIDRMIADLRQERALSGTANTEINVRSGEAGLSQLERLEMPLEVALPVGNGHVVLTANPVILHSGTVEGDALFRFGRRGLVAAPAELNSSLGDLGTLLDSIETPARGYFNARERADLALADATLPSSEKQRLVAEADAAEAGYQRALLRNPLYETGLQLANLSAEQREVFNTLYGDGSATDLASLRLGGETAAEFAASRLALETAVASLRSKLVAAANFPPPDPQRAGGVGLGLQYRNGSFAADIGSTPLGFEEVNVLGGIRWTPSIGANGQASLIFERRPVKDSILSYAGVKDAFTGDTWGGVVSTGGSIGFGYESEAGVGIYGDTGIHNFTGTNVAENSRFSLALGGYVQPVKNGRRTLQTGIHMSYLGFDENQGHFTFGHGGYFSPQNYLSVAFPISYQQTDDRLTWNLSLTPGYQSFTADASDYFPTDSASQSLLYMFQLLGAAPSSQYASNDQSGIGLAYGGGAEYRLSRDLTLGGRANFSSFGAFDDYSANIYLKYTKGDGP